MSSESETALQVIPPSTSTAMPNDQQLQQIQPQPQPECEPVTEEERLWMINDVKEKTRSLQELLLKYRQMEDDLKEQVMEMVLRDIHEQNIHIGMNKRVQSAQQEFLSDTAYVGWAMKHGKGEFAEDGASRKKAAAQPRQSDGSPHSWKDNIINAVAEQHQIQQKQQQSKEEIQTSSSSFLLPDPKLLASSLPLSTLVLPPRIALVLASSFQSLKDEESSMPELLKIRFNSFLTLIEVWKQRVEAHCQSQPTAICLNGIPLFLGNQSALLSGSKMILEPSTTTSSTSSSSSSCEENVSNVVNTWLRKTNQITSTEIIHDIFSTEFDSSREFFNALLKHGTNSDELMSTSVVGSSNDTLSLTPLRQLENSLLVYAVVSQTDAALVQVAAVEPVISSFALHLAKGFTPVTIRQQVEAFCNQIIGPLMTCKVIPKRCVLTLALKNPSLVASNNSEGGDASSLSSSSAAVVLDIAELNPQLPTSLLSWGDVCSILRQRQQTSASSSSSLSSSSNFIFRGQKSRIANLAQSIRDEKEEDSERDQEATTAHHKTVARCFLQLVENALNFEEDNSAKTQTVAENEAAVVVSRGQTNQNQNMTAKSESSSLGFPSLPTLGASLVAGAALIGGALLMLRKSNQKS